MSDDTRALFDRSIDAIHVPPVAPAHALRRGRILARRRHFVQVLAAAIILAGSAAVANGLLGDQSASPPVDLPSGEDLVDAQATRIVDDLGPICSGFDFYFKARFGPATYRPVQCGMVTSMRVVVDHPPTPTPGVEDEWRVRLRRGPTVVVHSFSEPAAARAWMDAHSPFRGGRIADDAWVVDVVMPSSFAAVQEELSTGRVVAEPRRKWVITGEHTVQGADRAYAPSIPLRRAARDVIEGPQELLAAQLSSYSEGGDLVFAWVLTVRRCVPQYGGPHESPYCLGDRTHIVIDSTSGRELARFST